MAALQKREKYLVSSAGVAVLCLAINYFLCGKSESSSPQANTKSEVVAAGSEKAASKDGATSKPKRRRRTRKKNVTFSSWVRDPFADAWRLAEATISKEDSSALVLRGVLRKGNEAYVLIGDQILKQGDERGDLKVISIKRDYVVCRKGRKIVRLVLGHD